jgi:hypothetical protein
VPFGLSFGWITAATLLNLALFLHAEVGWDGAPLSPVAWSVALVSVAATAGVGMCVVRRNLSFAVAIGWALLGIADYRRMDAAPLALISLALATALFLVVAIEAIGLSMGKLGVEAPRPVNR